MKGQDLVNRLARDGMPDLEQVRENCHRQAAPQKPLVRKLRWSTAAAIAACLVFATVVYAATVIMERFDTGGSMALTPVAYDSTEYQEQRASMFHMRPVYVSSHADEFLPPFIRFVSHEYFEGFDSETARMINEALAGKIFTADGTPFVLMTTMLNMLNQELYRADAGGNVLYNADGDKIGMINTLTTFDGEFTAFGYDGLLWVEILTVADLERLYGFTATYEDALLHLRRNFRLPTVHIEGLNPPKFRLEGFAETLGRVNIRYVSEGTFFDDLILSVENIRDESIEPAHLYFAGEIIEFEIAGLTIHKTASHTAPSSSVFWWIYDELVYSLIPPATLTDRQIEEIIRSMIE